MIQTATNPHYNYLVSHGLFIDIQLEARAYTNSLGTFQDAKIYLVVAGDRLEKYPVAFYFRSNGEDRNALMMQAPVTEEWTDLDCATRTLILRNQKYHTEKMLNDNWSIRKYREYRRPSNQE